MTHWRADEVPELLKELDPANTIILEYTTDSKSENSNFTTWGLSRRFPWIFGIFQGLESECDLGFDFAFTEAQIHQLDADPMCKGMVMWSESSHANPLLLEFLAVHATSSGSFSVEKFCADRYGETAAPMQELWQMILPGLAVNSWEHDRNNPLGEIFRFHFNLLSNIFHYNRLDRDKLMEACRAKAAKLPPLPGFFAKAAAIESSDDMVKRDLIDLCRTHLMNLISRERCLLQLELCQWRQGGEFHGDPPRLVHLIKAMRELLGTHPDYSLNESLRKLSSKRAINPYSESTLKSNAENNYCRSYIYELYQSIYISEAEFYANWINDTIHSGDRSRMECKEEFARVQAEIRDRFYATPLAELAPSSRILSTVLEQIKP